MTAYHITCAREAGLFTSMKDMHTPHAAFTSYCERHTPKIQRSQTVSPTKDSLAGIGSVKDIRDPLADLEIVKKKTGRALLSASNAKKKPKDTLPIILTFIFHRLINTANQ